MDQLDSWKEIAAHLGRTVRTVQRWETTCGLPIHRHGHAKSSSVYAFLSEVDRWWTSQQQPLRDGQTSIDLSAQQLQAMSRYYWNTRTVDGFQRSIALATRAAERDPRYAPAHAALAIAYATLGSYTSESPGGPMERARQSALHALELDETLADAHLALGFVSLCYDWDFDHARSLLGRALALNPQNASAWQWHSLIHLAAGDLSRGIEFARRAVELDTSSPILKAHLSWMLYFARRYEDALEQTGLALSRDPRFWRAYFNAGWCAIQLGDYDRAVNAMETMVALNDYPTARAALVVAYARAGR